MKKTYAAVVQQIEHLKAEAESLRQAEVAGVVDRTRDAINVYRLTPSDLFPSDAKPGRKPKALHWLPRVTHLQASRRVGMARNEITRPIGTRLGMNGAGEVLGLSGLRRL